MKINKLSLKKIYLLISLLLIIVGGITIGSGIHLADGNLSALSTEEPDKWYQTFHVEEDGSLMIGIRSGDFRITSFTLPPF